MLFSFLFQGFRGSAKRKTLAFFGVSLAFFQKSKGWRVREIYYRIVIYYRGTPCADTIFLGIADICPLKEGFTA